MDSGYLTQPAIFLIDTIFGLYLFALVLRFLFQWFNADYYNPISQMIVKVTQPPVGLLRRFIPPLGRVDSATLLLMLALQMIASYLVLTLQGVDLNPAALAVFATSQLLDLILNVLFFAIVITVVLSWFHVSRYNPAVSLLYSFTNPMLKWARKLLPPMGGLDLSPLIPIIGIQLVKMLVLPPLDQLVRMLS
ncbi:MAG: YggT family protein [Methylotetracoccus sp.]|jgi:YggT family protein|nr:YggT family protein [Methylotetracoccus sp.]